MDDSTLTLDTNLLHEYWKRRDKLQHVERLLDLARQGKVDLAVTARVHEDVPQLPLAQKLNELEELHIHRTSSVARPGYWVLERDMLGDDAFEDYWPSACTLAKQRGKKPPDWRDWDHLHAHHLLGRQVFLTWDEGINCLWEELRDRFGVVVMKPEEYLDALDESSIVA